eukprot:UN00800
MLVYLHHHQTMIYPHHHHHRMKHINHQHIVHRYQHYQQVIDIRNKYFSFFLKQRKLSFFTQIKPQICIISSYKHTQYIQSIFKY